MSHKLAVVIVDPIKSGLDLLESLKNSGNHVVPVFTLDVETVRSLGVPESLIGEAAFCVDVRVLAQKLNDGFGISAVIPASEPATCFTNQLSKKLGLASLHKSAPNRFRDKLSMRNFAETKGINVPSFAVYSAGSCEQVLLPARNVANIVKPSAAAGSDAIKVVYSEVEALEHMRLNTHDLFGKRIHRWLLEEYVVGREYAINTLSSANEHRIIDIWEYCQPDSTSNAIYDNPYWNTFQLAPGSTYNSLRLVALEILKKFEVEFGYSHIEVKMNSSGVTTLIEIAWRLPGAGMPTLWKEIWGFDPYVDIDAIYSGTPIQMDRFLPDNHKLPLLGLVFIPSRHEGTLEKLLGLEEVSEISGVHKVEAAAQGSSVEKTNSLQNNVAKVMIYATDRRQLEQIALKIRKSLVPVVSKT